MEKNSSLTRYVSRYVWTLTIWALATCLLADPFCIPYANAEVQGRLAPLEIEKMRAVTYTTAFADRFKLPVPGIGNEPEGGIQAMEFSVEPGRTGVPFYYCKLKIYLNSSLPVAYPEEGVAGSKHMLISPAHFFLWPDPANKRWLSLSREDRAHFGDRQGRYGQNAGLATPDYSYQERGGFHGLSYDEYHQDLFSGLAYLKVDLRCFPDRQLRQAPTWQLWLKKTGAKDYRQELRTDPEDFLKFAFPRAFLERVIVLSDQTQQYNRQVHENDDRPGQDPVKPKDANK